MKKFIGSFLFISLIAFVGVVQNFCTYYTRDVVVVDIIDDEIIVVDNTGNEWSFFGSGYAIDDSLTLIMSDNNTATLIDDEIIKVK